MDADFGYWFSALMRWLILLIGYIGPAILSLLATLTLMLGLKIGGLGVHERKPGWSSLGLVFTGMSLSASLATAAASEIGRRSTGWAVLGFSLFLVGLFALQSQAIAHLHLIRRSR